MSYTAPDFADDIEVAVLMHGAPASTLNPEETDNELAHLSLRVELALEQRAKLLAVLKRLNGRLGGGTMAQIDPKGELRVQIDAALGEAS